MCNVSPLHQENSILFEVNRRYKIKRFWTKHLDTLRYVLVKEMKNKFSFSFRLYIIHPIFFEYTLKPVVDCYDELWVSLCPVTLFVLLIMYNVSERQSNQFCRKRLLTWRRENIRSEENGNKLKPVFEQ